MTKKERERLARIEQRIDVLRSRIRQGTCKKLDQEKAELSALIWVIDKVEELEDTLTETNAALDNEILDHAATRQFLD